MTSKDIAVDVAELAGIIAEGPLFGVFLVLDIAAIYILMGRRHHSGLNIPMTLAAVVMLGLALAQYVVDSINIFMGFIELERATRLQFFSDITQPIFAAKHAIYFSMLFVGDVIVIYRAYIVWSSKILVIILPTLCSLASAASAYQTIYAVRHPPKVLTAEFGALEFRVGFAIFSLSLAANIISTGLIAYKIWSSDRGLKRSMAMSLHTSKIPITRIIIESGALNTAYILIYTIVLNNGTRGIETVACIVTPLVGIIFTTVIIRVTLAADAQVRSAHINKQTGPRISVKHYVSTDRDLAFTAESDRDEGIELTEQHSDHPYKSKSEPL